MLIDSTLELIDANILNQTMPADAHERELEQIATELIQGEPHLATRLSNGSQILIRTDNSLRPTDCNRQVVIRPLGLNLGDFSDLPQSMTLSSATNSTDSPQRGC